MEQLTPDEHRVALIGLKRAIEQEPNHAGCLAMLAIVYADGWQPNPPISSRTMPWTVRCV